jgi:hypothetical protein
MNAATPISKNRVIQTGANTPLGGVKDGFVRVTYQVVTVREVKTEPITPANWQTAILITSPRMLGIFMFPSIPKLLFYDASGTAAPEANRTRASAFPIADASQESPSSSPESLNGSLIYPRE